MAMYRRVSLARNVQDDGFHGMCDGLPSLPEREQSNGEGRAEEPEDADNDPA